MKLPLRLDAAPRAIDLLAVGENSMDLIAVVETLPQANTKMPLVDYGELPGGEAASAAVGVARLGWRAKYIGRFGGDRFGAAIRDHLAAEGIDVDDAIVVQDQTNRMAVILVDRRSGARSVLWRRGDKLALQRRDVPDRVLASSRVLLVGSDDVDATSDVVGRARRLGVRTVGDLEHVHAGTLDLVRDLDLVIMAASFPTMVTGQRDLGAAMHALARETNAALLCVTLGEDGCLALVAGKEIRVPAFRVEVVDTTGAGDLFRAGLIARWLAEPEHPGVLELLQYANAVAALNCRAVGAQTAAPRRDEVEALLRG